MAINNVNKSNDIEEGWSQFSINEPVKIILRITFFTRHSLNALQPFINIDQNKLYLGNLSVLRVVLLPELISNIVNELNQAMTGEFLGKSVVNLTISTSRLTSSVIGILSGCEKFGLPLPPQLKSLMFIGTVSAFGIETIGIYSKSLIESKNGNSVEKKNEKIIKPSRSVKMDVLIQSTSAAGSLILFGIIPLAAPIGSLLIVASAGASLYMTYNDQEVIPVSLSSGSIKPDKPDDLEN